MRSTKLPEMQKALKPVRNEEEEQMPEHHDVTKPHRPEEFRSEMISRKRIPSWAREVIEEAKVYGIPEGTIREIKNPKPYPSYVALMCN